MGDQRKALLRGLTTELVRHGRIKSTLRRCKEVRTTTDHMITLAKDGSLHARRQALGYLYDKELVHSLFEAVPERYADRDGGTRACFATATAGATTRRWASSSCCEPNFAEPATLMRAGPLRHGRQAGERD